MWIDKVRSYEAERIVQWKLWNMCIYSVLKRYNLVGPIIIRNKNDKAVLVSYAFVSCTDFYALVFWFIVFTDSSKSIFRNSDSMGNSPSCVVFFSLQFQLHSQLTVSNFRNMDTSYDTNRKIR